MSTPTPSFRILLTAAAATLCVTACTPPPPTVNAGGSGAFGVVTVGGKQKMYLPKRYSNANNDYEIAVVDVGTTGNGINGSPALIKMINLGPDDGAATTTGGDATVIVAASIVVPTVWLIDPNSDTVTRTLTLPSSFGQSNFSGGGGYVTGIAMDSAHHRAILSVWNGFSLLDTQSGTIVKTIEAPPSENFGFDAVAQKIFAPFYGCSYSNDSGGNPPAICDSYKDTNGYDMDGLNVIDLSDDSVYLYADDGDSINTSPEQPVGSEPDSAAADVNTHVVTLPSEGGGFHNTLDFAHATYDHTAMTVSATNHVVPYAYYTGAAAESSKHIGFYESEGGNTAGSIDLNAANAGTGVLHNGTMPALPGQGYWSNLGDPHGIAVTTGLADGHAVGFLVTSDYAWVARVDLEKFQSLTVDPDTGNVLDADFATAVTYLDATTTR